MARKNSQMLFGRHPVVDSIKAATAMDKVLLQAGTRGPFEKEIRQLCSLFNIPLQVVPKERLDRFTRANHQGIIAFQALVTYYNLEDVLPNLFESLDSPLVLLLDGITDVRNFGAIARSAEICGVQAIVIPKKGAAQVNAEAMKTSAGALARMTVCREQSLTKAVELLQLSGVQVLASELKASEPIYKVDMTLPTAIIMGSEDQGVNSSLLKKVNQRIIIPQKGKTDSFNVSVATGIILYEVMRQRSQG